MLGPRLQFSGHEPRTYLKDVPEHLPTQLNSRIDELLSVQRSSRTLSESGWLIVVEPSLTLQTIGLHASAAR